MEEKVIIKSKHVSKGKVLAMPAIICLGIAVVADAILFDISNFKNSIPEILIIATALFLIPYIYIAGLSKSELAVTDRRVYGKAMFGKRVDLPIDMISAVGTGMMKSIAVTSASGAIKFGLIQNRDSIHDAISKLLIERQSKPVSNTTVMQEIQQSSADELAKYKKLLDSGVISQEEFDAKKKQLLGL